MSVVPYLLPTKAATISPNVVISKAASAILWSNTAREIYKSIEDVMGDKKHNVTSLPIKLGVLKAKMIANAFVIASVIFSFAPFILGTFGQLYLFFVVIADIGFISAAIAPVRYSAKICKLSMIIALIAFIAAAVKI